MANPLLQLRAEIEGLGHPEVSELLEARNGAAKLLHELPRVFPVTEIRRREPQRVWELCGIFFEVSGRYHEAIAIHQALYDHLIARQLALDERIHKGTPLVWISQCHWKLGRPALAKRYLMLTLCEDAVILKGAIDPETTGVYFRIAWQHGMSDQEVSRYARQMYELSVEHSVEARFPEWILQHLDDKWIVEYPSQTEATFYRVNASYISWLLDRERSDGSVFELVADYLLSAIPGCRPSRRLTSHSTDYDILCAMEGEELDFRSEFGRYFVCECKDWKKPADITAFAKFCRILDSAKCTFGIIFSSNGITGSGKTKDAEREQLKVYQDRGMVIVVVSEKDIQQVIDGESFITMLRSKYETVRLDLNR